jgi:hypothetical protein
LKQKMMRLRRSRDFFERLQPHSLSFNCSINTQKDCGCSFKIKLDCFNIVIT